MYIRTYVYLSNCIEVGSPVVPRSSHSSCSPTRFFFPSPPMLTASPTTDARRLRRSGGLRLTEKSVYIHRQDDQTFFVMWMNVSIFLVTVGSGYDVCVYMYVFVSIEEGF